MQRENTQTPRYKCSCYLNQSQLKKKELEIGQLFKEKKTNEAFFPYITTSIISFNMYFKVEHAQVLQMEICKSASPFN